MRTTLSIDDDALAAQQGKSVGEAISELARHVLRPSRPGGDIRDGVPLLPSRAATAVTLEHVNRLRDELP